MSGSSGLTTSSNSTCRRPACRHCSQVPLQMRACLQLYEKRKLAALEVEQLVKRLSAGGNTERIAQIIDCLVNVYATSSQVGWQQFLFLLFLLRSQQL